ncbi:TPA: hypothetical protein N0F65_012371 [Lagenidium giganteum]|uniref:Amino acid transporter transmembrane domain-containing protein n=1 Tax=Lagenidium giganteum TaxID=4803 RepID=A0AAV2YPN9_9STRA|nr:TPA: hypothetical protein N0F65_012371 [Lagenidium giganteum]
MAPKLEGAPLLPRHDDAAVLAKSKPSAHQEGSPFSAYLGLATTMMGACILTLPSTLEAVGVWFGLVVYVFVGWLAYQSFEMICVCCDATDEFSYEALSSRLFGATGVWVFRALTFVLLFGSIVMYMVITMDLFEPFLTGIMPRSSIGLLFTLVAIPLCLPETIHELRYANMLVLACIAYIVVALCVRTAGDDPDFVAHIQPNPTNNFKSEIAATAYVLPIISLSFACQLNVPRAYKEIHDKAAIRHVHQALVGSGLFFYVSFAVLGYACFHGHPPSDILTGFRANDTIINGARLCLGTSMIFKTPMSFQPLRQVLELCCLGHNRENLRFRLAITVVIMFLAYGLSLTSRDLGIVMSFIGAVAGNLLSITTPGLFLWEIMSNASFEHNSGYSRGRALFMVCTGVVFCVVSVMYLIYNAAS